jgi:putative ABC transport system ATP-binding protein
LGGADVTIDPDSALHIQAENVRVVFDDCVVLDAVSLGVAPGEIVALQGSSGSGKTTFLHAIAGFVALESGTIHVGGKSLVDNTESERAAFRRDVLGLMTQDFHLLSKLSAERNAALAPLLAGQSPADALHAARELLNRLGLAEHHKAAPNRLSRGQRQRVALARALAIQRPFLLLDEPTSSLDDGSKKTVMELVREHAAAGSAVLIATHDHRILPWVDRVLHMKDGRIVTESAAVSP